MKFIGRIAGYVHYTDGTTDRFASHLDERGIISAIPSNEAILELQDDQWVEKAIIWLTNRLWS